MSGKQYLKNQLPVLLLNLLGVLALALFLIATGTSRQAISFIALVWIVVVVCYLTVSFFIQKRHCETLLVMAEQLGEKYLMPEVMAMPERADEQVFYQILKMAEKQQEHRMTLETKVVGSQTLQSKRGQVFGFIIVFLCVAVAIFFAVKLHMTTFAASFLSVTMVVVVGLFLTGRNVMKKDLESKSRDQRKDK